jgi:hypothetical protein
LSEPRVNKPMSSPTLIKLLSKVLSSIIWEILRELGIKFVFPIRRH